MHASLQHVLISWRQFAEATALPVRILLLLKQIISLKYGCSEKNMNCKLKQLKLHNKGFLCYQSLGAVTVLKFIKTLALNFPYICRQLEN